MKLNNKMLGLVLSGILVVSLGVSCTEKKEVVEPTIEEAIEVEKDVKEEVKEVKISDSYKIEEEYDEEGERHYIRISTKAIDNLTTDMMLASNEKVFEDILKDLLNKGKVKDDSLIQINFLGDMIDKYGNKYEGSWLMVGIYGSEVLKCDFDNLHSGDIFGKLTVSVGMPTNIRQDIKLDGSYSHLRPINN